MDYDEAQFYKGLLEGMILLSIWHEPIYGYIVSEALQVYGITLKEGSIYPILLRLERKKLISSEFRVSPNGPSRKYYCLTESGKEYVDHFLELWQTAKHAIDGLVRKEGSL